MTCSMLPVLLRVSSSPEVMSTFEPTKLQSRLIYNSLCVDQGNKQMGCLAPTHS